MPGVAALEDRLVLDQHCRDKELHWFETECSDLLVSLFSISREDTLFQYPEGYEDKTLSFEERCDADEAAALHEEQFETEKMPWDEDKVEYLKKLGWDLTRNDKKQPLQITRHVCRVIEAVAKGIAGKAPEADVLDAKLWEEKLREAANQFSRKKRTGGAA